ncbi:M23 family metallopeptidase [Paraburkholderia sp. DHOC27]|uniref:M23 family metallopeptidase n=1 Tax=Paraburkholderia sp. DHOC27 TaxID=2303330 RepID=UPI000E3BD5EC|nr:M23 family metallopeptidase [Paraburkholderia sp. DHOC27]RFU45216.1 M23 family peptidase [Paraburkholderia sp. DHOC27]
MSSILGAGSQLSRGEVRFVTRRTALTIAIAAAAGTSLLALALGVVVGMHLPGREPANVGVHPANRVEHDYAIDQLGKLNASMAQIEPRIERLTSQVGTLRDFEARLKTPRAAAGVPASSTEQGTADADGEGGPSLPPRPCVEVTAQARSHDAAATQQQLDCINATLSALEHEANVHEVAFSAFPGRMPADGARFGSPFGNRFDPFTHRLSFHPGVDLVAPSGTAILAAAGGRVIFAGVKNGYGNAVEIDHGNGLITRYGHASRILVHEGDLVLPRQHVADVGSTGRSTGPHLHFEVLVNGAPVDPTAYLALFSGTHHD